MPKTAGISLVGNEFLSGKIVHANASFLCRELRALGVEVRRISVIPDEADLIAGEVARFAADYDVVFTSGGVGPTHDDVTIEGVARAAGVPVVRHPALVALLEGYYRSALSDAHLKMAEVPEGAELLVDESVRVPSSSIAACEGSRSAPPSSLSACSSSTSGVPRSAIRPRDSTPRWRKPWRRAATGSPCRSTACATS